MDLINKEVIHEIFGEGKIISNVDGYLTIEFSEEEKNFVFPDAFKSFLKFKNNKDTQLLLPAIKEEFLIKQEEEEERQELIKKERMLKLEAHRAAKNSKGKSKSKSRRSIQESSNLAFRYSYGDGIQEWKAYAGSVLKGDNKGNPKKIGRAQKNTLSILTACDPDASEDTRYIYGVFLVDETFKGDANEEGYVSSNSKYKIKLSKEEAQDLLFWNYYANTTNPQNILWNSGQFRYFHNNQAAQILRDIVEIKKDTEDEDLAKEFFEHFCEVNRISIDTLGEVSGALKQTELAK